VPSADQQELKGGEAEYKRRSGSNSVPVRARLAPEAQCCTSTAAVLLSTPPRVIQISWLESSYD